MSALGAVLLALLALAGLALIYVFIRIGHALAGAEGEIVDTVSEATAIVKQTRDQLANVDARLQRFEAKLNQLRADGGAADTARGHGPHDEG